MKTNLIQACMPLSSNISNFCDWHTNLNINDADDRVDLNLKIPTKRLYDAPEWRENLLSHLVKELLNHAQNHKYKSLKCPEISKELKENLEICFIEAVNNAIIHGNLGLTRSLKDNKNDFLNLLEQYNQVNSSSQCLQKHVDITLTLTQQSLSISIKDEGSGYDFPAILSQLHEVYIGNIKPFSKDGYKYKGRGLMLINACCDDMIISNHGTTVKMLWDLPEPQQDKDQH